MNAKCITRRLLDFDNLKVRNCQYLTSFVSQKCSPPLPRPRLPSCGCGRWSTSTTSSARSTSASGSKSWNLPSVRIIKGILFKFRNGYIVCDEVFRAFIDFSSTWRHHISGESSDAFYNIRSSNLVCTAFRVSYDPWHTWWTDQKQISWDIKMPHEVPVTSILTQTCATVLISSQSSMMLKRKNDASVVSLKTENNLMK